MKELDDMIRRSMREYWRGKKKSSLHDIDFLATSQLKPQRRDVASKRISLTLSTTQSPRRKQWSFHQQNKSAVQSRSISSPFTSTNNILATTILKLGPVAPQSLPSSLDALSLQIANFDVLSIIENATDCKICLSKHDRTTQCTFVPEAGKYFIY